MRRAMLTLTLFLCCGLLAPRLSAREGFSIHLGLGGGIWNLGAESLGERLTEIHRPAAEGALLTDSLDHGLALRLAFAYNIKGYASVELGITGHGWNLGNSDALGGSGHSSLVAHIHPLHFFLPADRPYDASLFLGGGYSLVGGGQADDNRSRALDGGALECGLAGRYFFTDWFSLGAELRLTVPFYNRWVVDWGDGEDYDLDGSPSAVFVALLVHTGFHFTPAGDPP